MKRQDMTLRRSATQRASARKGTAYSAGRGTPLTICIPKLSGRVLALAVHAARARAHGDQLLSGGGVDADRGVKIRLGGARLERDRDALQHLGALWAAHVHAHHLLAKRAYI